MRITKEAEERKNDILDAAEELFSVKGYEHTSTNDILDKVGIARGTLYYHFKSKEEILDALIARTVEAINQKVKESVSENMNAAERIAALIGAIRVESGIGKEIATEAHKPQNALMHQKMQAQLLSSIIPVISSLIKDGIRAGCFETDYPDEVAEMLMLYSSIVFDDLNEITDTERQKKVAGFIFNMERLLGLKLGSLLEIANSIH